MGCARAASVSSSASVNTGCGLTSTKKRKRIGRGQSGQQAAGLSGPGRYRFGGLRDFILGVRFVDGDGRLLRLGGRVVKNAAGFDLPVGELEAIAEGRQPSAADRRRTVRDTDPDLSRDVQQQIAQARPVMESSLKALTAALPAMLKSLEQAGQALDRAAANLPSPTYPKR